MTIELKEGLREELTYVDGSPYVISDYHHESEFFTWLLALFYDLLRFVLYSIPTLFQYVIEFFKPPPPKNIRGQTALVTGGGNGIGREIAIRLAKEGCNIAIVDVDFAAAKRTASDVKSFYVNAIAYEGDVSDPEEVKRLKREIEDDLGSVDILVNNAGIMPHYSYREVSEDEIRRIFNINALSTIWTTRAFIESMIRRRKGHILTISSLTGLVGIPFLTTYSATKHALKGFTEALQNELIMDGLENEIFVTTVYPFFVNTRKDIVDAVNKAKALRPYSELMRADRVAEEAVYGMLTNKSRVLLPKLFAHMLHYGVGELLPLRLKTVLLKKVIKLRRHFKSEV